MTWHSDADTRKRIGDEAETAFAKTVICSCGGRFSRIGDLKPGFPDFTCDNCGQLVDVKASPQSERTGNIAVSAIPWSRYPTDLLLVTRIRGQWLAQYKRSIAVLNRVPFEPTHNGGHRQYGNTRFHLIAWKDFKPIQAFGFSVSE